MTELVPESFRELLDFYTEFHPHARFGDLDLAALQQGVEALELAAQEVEDAEAVVVRAREEFRIAETELLGTAARAVSFLKIHVEDDSAQLARLESIGSGLNVPRRKTKPLADSPAPAPADTRQRRPRKGKHAEPSPTQSNLLDRAGLPEEPLTATDHELNQSIQEESGPLAATSMASAAAE
jgi:hypothetical protein